MILLMRWSHSGNTRFGAVEPIDDVPPERRPATT